MVDSTAQNSYRGHGSLDSFSAVIKNVDGTRTIDITPYVLDLSIYEDIFSKTMFGAMSIKDSVNLMNGLTASTSSFKTFPIVGEEFVEFSYQVFSYPQVFRRFAVNAIKEIDINSAFTERSYIIEFCSEEYIYDATTLVQKSYNNLQISKMVEDVLKNYLYVDKTLPNGKKAKTYDIQTTKGPQNIVVPKLSPLETLDFFSRRSVAQNVFQSATYHFFENKDGFNFCDIEYLIQRGKKKYASNPVQYQYYYSNVNLQPNAGTTQQVQDDSKTFKTLIGLKQKHKFDTIEKIRNGYFESDALVYDINARKLIPNTFKFVDNYTNLNTLGAGGSANSATASVSETSYPENSLDFIKNVTANAQSSSVASGILGLFGLMSNKPNTGRHTKTFFIVKDSTAPDTFLEQIYMNRASYMTRLAQNMFTAEVYGDSNIGAGDVITIDLPEITGMSKSKTDFDTFLSGYFLVTSIHHMITPETYRCRYDLFKNGFSRPVITTDSTAVPDPSNSAYLNNIANTAGT